MPVDRRRCLWGALAVLVCLAALAACGGEPEPEPPGRDLSPIETRGLMVFTLHCAPCHATAPDTIIAGPSLSEIAVRAGERLPEFDAESYIRSSILSPYDYLVDGYTETMPPDFGKRLTGEDFDAVVAYLLTLE